MERLYSPWRLRYVASEKRVGTACVFCRAVRSGAIETTWSSSGVAATSSSSTSTPTTTATCMIVPNAHLASPSDSTSEALSEFMTLVVRCERALREVYRPSGVNLGMNLGRSAGAGIEGHYHLHLVPRWAGDTNFMTVAAGTRVIPESLRTSYRRLSAALRSRPGDRGSHRAGGEPADEALPHRDLGLPDERARLREDGRLAGSARATSARPAPRRPTSSCSTPAASARRPRTRCSPAGEPAPAEAANPDLVIGVCGCVAQQEGRRSSSARPWVDIVIGAADHRAAAGQLMEQARRDAPLDRAGAGRRSDRLSRRDRRRGLQHRRPTSPSSKGATSAARSASCRTRGAGGLAARRRRSSARSQDSRPARLP